MKSITDFLTPEEKATLFSIGARVLSSFLKDIEMSQNNSQPISVAAIAGTTEQSSNTAPATPSLKETAQTLSSAFVAKMKDDYSHILDAIKTEDLPAFQNAALSYAKLMQEMIENPDKKEQLTQSMESVKNTILNTEATVSWRPMTVVQDVTKFAFEQVLPHLLPALIAAI